MNESDKDVLGVNIEGALQIELSASHTTASIKNSAIDPRHAIVEYDVSLQ
ncbi:MAG: hypothetical protein J7M14_00905 [Planctomycetes bacterium]|nr:hypothetical protein [Planctomycetota bacterium]